MGLVDVEVGSSSSKLSLVVDTGSNVLIVESCECQNTEVCPPSESCFDNATSGSFAQLKLPNGTGRELVLRFGSGLVRGRIARDSVKIGKGPPIDMLDGILLMTDRAMDFDDRFEGILGLGPPTALIQKAEADARHQAEEQLKEMKKAAQNGTPEERAAVKEIEDQLNLEADQSNPEPRGFLEQAGQSRFSLCFGKGDDSNGTLVVGGAPADRSLKSVGMLHWGLAMEGVFVNGTAVMVQPLDNEDLIKQAIAQAISEGADIDPEAIAAAQQAAAQAAAYGTPFANISSIVVGAVKDQKKRKDVPSVSKLQLKKVKALKKKRAAPKPMCSRTGGLQEGQETPCGGIPDSGTTALAMPQAHLTALAEAICDNWDRCQKNFTKLNEAKIAAEEAARNVYGVNPFEIPEYSKADVLSFVLSDCANLDKSIEEVMDELPDIQVTLGDGTLDNTMNVSIPGPSYVFQMDLNAALQDMLDKANGDSGAVGQVPAQMACTLGLQATEYNTQKNGDIWILGKPLFHEYTVHYDLAGNTIGFKSTEDEPCGVCQASGQLGLLSSEVSTGQHVALRHRAPLKVRGGFRRPRVDTTKPL